jgi:hypothetical protein
MHGLGGWVEQEVRVKMRVKARLRGRDNRLQPNRIAVWCS